MNWPALVAAALALWGWVFPGAITVVEDDSGDSLETGRVIAGLNARTFCWNSVQALWYPVK